MILKLIYNESDCEVFAVLIVTLNITFDHFIVDQIFIQLNKFNSLTLGYFTVIIKCDNCDEWIIIQMVYSNIQSGPNGSRSTRVMWGRCVKEYVHAGSIRVMNLENGKSKITKYKI